MMLEQIKKELQNPMYSFLKNNEHLGKNIILLGSLIATCGRP